MTLRPESIDLVVLVPGKNEQAAIEGLLDSRCRSLQIRSIKYKIFVHPRNDPGCFLEAPHVLQPYLNRARYALVMLDHYGSGQENRSVDDLCKDVEKRLARAGWKKRTGVVVISPELEAWVWSDSPLVDRALAWENRNPALREWLRSKELLDPNASKPGSPKRALDAALREVRVPRSSAIYREIAEHVSLEHCQDTAFGRLKGILQSWFGDVNT